MKVTKAPWLTFWLMGFNSSSYENSSQNLNFQVEKQPPQLSIDTESNKNKNEFAILYRDYYAFVFRRCFFILHNEEDAHDAAHDIFANMQELISEGKLEVSHPKTFLSAVARNMGFNINKKARRDLNKLYDIATNTGLDWYKNTEEGQRNENWEAGIIDNGYEQVEAEIIVKAVLEEKDETTRKIYYYKYHDDMTLEQIAEVIGLGKSAVHKRLKILEEQVKTALGGNGK